MWSKFYFNKKHYGYLNAFIKVFQNFITLIKYIFLFFINNKNKQKIYLNRDIWFY